MRTGKVLSATAPLPLILLLLAGPLAGQRTAAEKHAKTDENLARLVHHQLLTLPYYSVFDNLVFTIDGDRVTLSGQVVRPTLKENAEAAVKSLEGVAMLVSMIEVLPKSPSDDELRRELYRIIFEDEVLKQYAIQGVPAIHIIVKNGAVALEGTVNSKSDKDLAEKRAGSVGLQNLANHLVVHEKEFAAK
jgi:hyperosmotically inducible periplasmic protein